MASVTELDLPTEATAHGFYRGRVGMSALLACLDLAPDTIIAIQAFTCRAVPDAIKVSGFEPVYVDIEPGGVNMSPEALAATVDDRTRVVVVQHTYGIPAQIDAIAKFCADTGRHLIEDCCHSITSTLDGRRVGSFGVGGFTSFEWGKELIVGVGGAAWANDPAVARRLAQHWSTLGTPSAVIAARQSIQLHAFHLLYRPTTYWALKRAFAVLGRVGAIESNAVPQGTEEPDAAEYDQRLHPWAARRLSRAVRGLTEASSARQRLCATYRERIVNPATAHVEVPAGAAGGWVRYPLRVPAKARLLQEARRRRVELADWYATPVDPLPEHDAEAVGYRAGSCPNAERLCEEVVTLPGNGSRDSGHTRRAVDLINEWRPA